MSAPENTLPLPVPVEVLTYTLRHLPLHAVPAVTLTCRAFRAAVVGDAAYWLARQNEAAAAVNAHNRAFSETVGCGWRTRVDARSRAFVAAHGAAVARDVGTVRWLCATFLGERADADDARALLREVARIAAATSQLALLEVVYLRMPGAVDWTVLAAAAGAAGAAAVDVFDWAWARAASGAREKAGASSGALLARAAGGGSAPMVERVAALTKPRSHCAAQVAAAKGGHVAVLVALRERAARSEERVAVDSLGALRAALCAGQLEVAERLLEWRGARLLESVRADSLLYEDARGVPVETVEWLAARRPASVPPLSLMHAALVTGRADLVEWVAPRVWAREGQAVRYVAARMRGGWRNKPRVRANVLAVLEELAGGPRGAEFGVDADVVAELSAVA